MELNVSHKYDSSQANPKSFNCNYKGKQNETQLRSQSSLLTGDIQMHLKFQVVPGVSSNLLTFFFPYLSHLISPLRYFYLDLLLLCPLKKSCCPVLSNYWFLCKFKEFWSQMNTKGVVCVWNYPRKFDEIAVTEELLK